MGRWISLGSGVSVASGVSIGSAVSFGSAVSVSVSVKTVGDAYMVVGGAPEARPDHAEAVADFALAIGSVLERAVGGAWPGVKVRIGIDTGPLVAGVIGRQKLVYGVWGDTVNTASRMESHGLPGAIHVTERTHEPLRATFDLEPRGEIEVKGKERMTTYLLRGRADGSRMVPLRADVPLAQAIRITCRR